MEGVGTPALAIIGAGRAGSALAIAAHDAGYRVAAVASRRGEMAARLADTVGARAVATPVEAVVLADLTLLAVPDGAIATVAASIAESGVSLDGRGVVHLGARFGPEIIGSLRTTGAEIGVLHPLQALAGPDSASLLEGAFFRVDATGRLREQLLALVVCAPRHSARDRPRGRAALSRRGSARRQRPAGPARGGDATARGRRGARRGCPRGARRPARGRRAQRTTGGTCRRAHRAGRTGGPRRDRRPSRRPRAVSRSTRPLPDSHASDGVAPRDPARSG